MRRYILLALISALTLVSLLGFVPAHWWWGFDLLSHPRPQYSLGLALGLGFALMLRAWRLGLFVLLALGLNISVLWSWYVEKPYVLPTHKSLSITHVNLDKGQIDKLRLFKQLRQRTPDLLFLQELTPTFLATLRQDLPHYQILLAKALNNTHGSAILVHKQAGLNILAATELHLPNHATRPLLSVSLNWQGQVLQLLSLHTTRVTDANNLAWQATEFAAAAAWSRTQQQAGVQVLVIGDFNATPWSKNYQDFAKAAQLDGLLKHRGTWPAYLPAFLRIPIDHALASPRLHISEKITGDSIGGDHLPVHILLDFIPEANSSP